MTRTMCAFGNALTYYVCMHIRKCVRVCVYVRMLLNVYVMILLLNMRKAGHVAEIIVKIQCCIYISTLKK